MSGFGRDIGWQAVLSVAMSFAAVLVRQEKRRFCDVIDLPPPPHWLYRDIEPGSGRVTRQAMRRPPNWPDPSR